jgi:hypothetical protein
MSMNSEQLMEAVRNLLSIREVNAWITCDQCNEGKRGSIGEVGGEYVCADCIRTHAALVLQHAESCCEVR